MRVSLRRGACGIRNPRNMQGLLPLLSEAQTKGLLSPAKFFLASQGCVCINSAELGRAKQTAINDQVVSCRL